MLHLQHDQSIIIYMEHYFSNYMIERDGDELTITLTGKNGDGGTFAWCLPEWTFSGYFAPEGSIPLKQYLRFFNRMGAIVNFDMATPKRFWLF